MRIEGLNPRRMLAIEVLLLLLAAASPCGAQDAPTPSGANEVNQQLLQRVADLEAKVKELEAKQGQSSAAAMQAVAEPAPAVDISTSNNEPRLKMNVFGDVGLQGYNGSPTSFFFGSLDMFMTARLSDQVSALGEILFLPDIADNSISADVERLFINYHPNDYFNASIGRYHTWVGYYNSTFNRGEFLETAADRPFIYAYDDFGGVLPMQDVGVSATGKIPSGNLGLHWVMEVGNGRAWAMNVEPAQNRQDGNGSKAVNGGLFVRPEQIPGLQVGFSLRHDNLTIPGPAIHETIATAHVVYSNSGYELLNEAVLDRHAEPVGSTFNTTGGYSQIARRFHALMPYGRFQFFNAPANDPVYAYAPQNDYAPSTYTGFVSRLDGPSAGIRYDFTEHSAVKFQYDRFFFRGLPDENGLTSQFAFTF